MTRLHAARRCPGSTPRPAPRTSCSGSLTRLGFPVPWVKAPGRNCPLISQTPIANFGETDRILLTHREGTHGSSLAVEPAFSTTQCPSIGLGLLKAALARQGIGCDTRYLNLWFAERLRTALSDLDEPYESLRRRFSLLGEWIFREAAFGPDANESSASVEQFLHQYSRYQPRRTGAPDIDIAALAEVVLRARREAEPFLDECMEAIDWQAVSIIGFSLMFNQNLASLALAKRVKARYPDKIVVLGGAACEEKMANRCTGCSPSWTSSARRRRSDLPRPGEPFVGRTPDRGHPEHRLPPRRRSCSNLGKPCPKADLDALPHPDYDDYFDDLSKTKEFPAAAMAGV